MSQVLLRLNTLVEHNHHCMHCRKLWKCTLSQCDTGFAKLCPPCHRECTTAPYPPQHTRQFDIDAEITDTRLP